MVALLRVSQRGLEGCQESFMLLNISLFNLCLDSLDLGNSAEACGSVVDLYEALCLILIPSTSFDVFISCCLRPAITLPPFTAQHLQAAQTDHSTIPIPAPLTKLMLIVWE